MTKAIQRISAGRHEILMFWLLVGAIVSSGALYTFFVHNIVANVVERTALQQQISALSANTTDLESQYLALSNTITAELATSLGYKEVASPELIQRQSSVSVAMVK